MMLMLMLLLLLLLVVVVVVYVVVVKRREEKRREEKRRGRDGKGREGKGKARAIARARARNSGNLIQRLHKRKRDEHIIIQFGGSTQAQGVAAKVRPLHASEVYRASRTLARVWARLIMVSKFPVQGHASQLSSKSTGAPRP